MLLELRIRDIAIIDELSVEPVRGLNVFTGETGAGKSIIIDALALVLGARASTDLIRSGCDEAVVEALFDAAGDGGVAAVLEEAGIEAADELVVKRVLTRSGRNRVYVNGSMTSLAVLSALSARLVDILGQSEHQRLTRAEEHMGLLDGYGGLGAAAERMARLWDELADACGRLERLRAEAAARAGREELLRFQRDEIEAAALSPGEDDELEAQRRRLASAERLASMSGEAESVLYSQSGAVVEKIGAVVRALSEMERIDPALEEVRKGLESALYAVEDAAAFLRDYASTVEADPARLDEVQGRLDLIGRLKRKYGAAIEDILERKAAIEAELEGLEETDGRVAELDRRVAEARSAALEAAGELSKARRAAAARLEESLVGEMADLGMEGCAFRVEIDSDPSRLSASGVDRVRFLIATNAGEELKPLDRVASGGELSRIMLAMKRLGAAGSVPTLVFDEVDAGIGGTTARAVGGKLREVADAGGRQVLCITHLPQIAALADRHFCVSKGRRPSGRTVTTVEVVTGERRVEALARMLGGARTSGAVMDHARELIDGAAAEKT
ncbi:MAG TPA: DNA repair protein RecN [Deltaproteobacteria bacterium]|nr:DNA repair protein RecN [Deltaproteobacteria bacterium]